MFRPLSTFSSKLGPILGFFNQWHLNFGYWSSSFNALMLQYWVYITKLGFRLHSINSYKASIFQYNNCKLLLNFFTHIYCLLLRKEWSPIPLPQSQLARTAYFKKSKWNNSPFEFFFIILRINDTRNYRKTTFSLNLLMSSISCHITLNLAIFVDNL